MVTHYYYNISILLYADNIALIGGTYSDMQTILDWVTTGATTGSSKSTLANQEPYTLEAQRETKPDYLSIRE